MTNKTHYPDPLASWAEKQTEDYGLAYAKTIAKEWFEGGMIDTTGSQYYDRRTYIRNNRLLARGEQDVESIKDHMARQEGDLDYMNLTWEPVNIAGKFCRVVYNGINDDNYTLDIRATDKLSLLKKKETFENRRNTMRSIPLLTKVKEQLGLNLIPKDFIARDEEELRLYSEIKDRPKVEIAEEIIIDYINKVNDQESLERKKNKDLVEIGICAERVWTDPVNGISFEWVDPEYLVHSYINQYNFNKKCYYFGYIDTTVTIDDLKRETNLTEKELREIASNYKNLNKSSLVIEECSFKELLDFRVHVLRFTFKTNKVRVHKAYKKNNKITKVKLKDENYDPQERSDYGAIKDVRDTWMEGSYIIDSEHIYGYKECENIIRDERNKAVAPFNVVAPDIYKNKLRSFLDDIRTPQRELQFIHLKMQHLTAELKPDLTIINEDALADISGSGKKAQQWQETLNLLNVKGVIVEKTIDMGEMGVQRVQAARPAANQQGSALGALLNSWAHYYNLIRESTGINPARDGSLPHDALLGVNKMAELASNTATKHIVDASIQFNINHAEIISQRIHHIYKSNHDGAKRIRKMYERAVGKQNVDALEPLKNRHLHDFGFTVNMVPTAKELQDFKDALAITLQEGLIDVEVKHQAEQIARNNMKLANQYLFYMRKRRREEIIEDKQKEAAFKSKQDQQSAILATQAKAQAYGVEAKIDLDKEAKLMQLRLLEAKSMQQITAPERKEKFEQELLLKQIESISNMDVKKYLEDRKDERTRIQAGQQSKLIDQRTKDKTPIDFSESSIFDDIFNS